MRDLAPVPRRFLIGCLVALGLFSYARADEPNNLLLNPGAEQGKGDQPSVWFAAHRPDSPARMWRATDQKHSGKASLAIASDRDEKPLAANNWSQEIADPPIGRVLRLSAYLKAKDADAVNVCVQCWSGDGKDLLAFASTPVFRGDQDWILVRSSAITIPEGTATVIVRAALTGRGEAWFDDLALVVLGPPLSGRPAAGPDDHGLARAVPGRTVKTIPIEKDCMVLNYLPDWDHGDIDNLAVQDSGGGVRTLLQWPAVPTDDLATPGRKALLALYARKVSAGTHPSDIEVYDLRADWPEKTSWTTQPPAAPSAASKTSFAAGEGWKIFDVTRLVRDRDGAAGHGVLLRFANEPQENDLSSYHFVSREGLGEWADRHPVLLIVEPEKVGEGDKNDY
jgi:hypothetical protein